MTLTLFGRWQTRILLMTLLGLPITAVHVLLNNTASGPFYVLGYVLLFGLGWDLLYNYIQGLRWNRDWPPLFALYAGLWEGACLYVLMQVALPVWERFGLSLLPGVPVFVPIARFWLHYGLVFAPTYLASLGLLHVLLPHWRYRGGQWL